MKKILLVTAVLMSVSTYSWADKIIIDVAGSGSVSVEGNHYTFNCSASADCCGSIIFECDVVPGVPSSGDPTTVRECYLTPDDIVHEWVGGFVSNTVTTDETGSHGVVTISNPQQNF